MSRVLCVDFGSTFTKAVLVDADDGTLVATASHRTTIETDVLDGLDAIRAQLAGERVDDVVACSSAGGGLRLAVVGYERVVTAEAGHRVGLSAGAKVVHVAAGELTRDDVEQLRASRPDVVLLVGGTDGGNAEVLCHNARRLGIARIAAPIVLAGNADAAADAAGRAAVTRAPGHGRGQRAAAHRRPRARAGAPRDPRGVHPPRDRRQGAVEGAAVREPRAGCDAGRRPRRRGRARGRRRPASRGPVTCWWSTSAAPRPTSTPR